ncbi:hypothetical protein [Mycolicibacterium goodii]|uniref:hypothetical protein n=1 Tax=Mycolicibacterium goodii TaxID=134601 RepID=UPI000C26B2D1|nr:hypothetical protein [Mycolicibacterium goodii]PJK24408.1 hypothetical protein CSX11_00650 [Mycolicibacterium goodii]
MDDFDLPILNEQQLFEYLHNDLGVTGVTRRGVKHAVMRREIVPTRIGNKNYFAKQDAHDWLKAQRHPVARRGRPDFVAAVGE